MIEALGPLEELSHLDSRWPSGFKSVILARIARERGGVFYSPKEDPTDVKEELSSFGVAAVGTQEDWREAVSPGKPLVFIGPTRDIPRTLEKLDSMRFTRIAPGARVSPEDLTRALSEGGLERVDFVELPGEFSRRGGIIDLFLPSLASPVRIEFVGNRVESIREFSVVTQRSTGAADEIWVPDPRGAPLGIGELVQLGEERSNPLPFDVQATPEFRGDVALFYSSAKELAERGYEINFFTLEEWRFRRLNEVVPCRWIKGELRHGFIIPHLSLVGMSSGEIVQVERATRLPGPRIESIEALEEGDYVVHIDYGIGRYAGLERVEIGGGLYECVVVEYADGRLLVPSHDLSRLSRYVGPEGFNPPLSQISKPTMWLRRRNRAAADAARIARELVFTAAIRKSRRGHAFGPDTPEQRELEMAFPFPETPDQEKAIEDVKRDMESPKVMERLVAGEVGFGKTEVALRASFKAVMDGKQVAILVPTTLLALQHTRTFQERLSRFPVRVEMVSRLVSGRKIKDILQDLKSGKVDIVIGTHRLLAKDVAFKDLGLLVIDEEHRFGVRQKERLKRLKITVDTLLMTATPIPRTLSMALGKIMDMSVIETPPIGRQETETWVGEFSERVVKNAINRELNRNGQVFYIRNRIEGLSERERSLRRMFPEAKIRAIHGRLRGREIERAFLDFYEGKIDILLSTAIVESGIDFPRANTLIVEQAELFGLSELHQLRGRVGRGSVKAYAFFFTGKDIDKKPKAKRRLSALARYHHIGSGMKIALADLSIRGGGDLLGLAQHGHARGVGYTLYFSLIDEAIESLTYGGGRRETLLEIHAPALIPEAYLDDPTLRMAYYTRLSEARAIYEIDETEDEMRDRFGPLPPELENLLNAHRVRLWAGERGYERVIFSPDIVQLRREGEEEILPTEGILGELI
ncbi:MAG: DEAD/DEAH box helicase [candidate division WOR-3 bacterium]